MALLQKTLSRFGQLILGFLLIVFSAIPNHIWHFAFHPVGVVLVMSTFGWMIGKRVRTPLTSAVLYNLAGFLYNGWECIFNGNEHLWPNSFPFISILGTFTLWLGIIARHGRLPRLSFMAVNASLLLMGGVMAAYIIPNDLFLSITRYPAVDASGIVLKGLNTPDITIASSQNSAYVFDFWSTRCGACYELKPLMMSLAKRWEADPRVHFGSIASAHFDSLPAVQAADYLHVGSPLSMPEYYDSTGRLAMLLAPTGCPVVALVNARGRAIWAQPGYSEMTMPLYEKWLERRIREMLEDA